MATRTESSTVNADAGAGLSTLFGIAAAAAVVMGALSFALARRSSGPAATLRRDRALFAPKRR